jgi:hypothetical protein
MGKQLPHTLVYTHSNDSFYLFTFEYRIRVFSVGGQQYEWRRRPDNPSNYDVSNISPKQEEKETC